MMARRCPAAYIHAVHGDAGGLARQREAVAQGGRQRGWSPPMIYAEDDADLAAGRAPELARLAAAIEAGRHDALLVTEPGAVLGTTGQLIDLLLRCSRNGVTVGFLLPPALAGPPVMQVPPATTAPARPPVLAAREDWAVLSRARMEALSGLFPEWRIWLDQAGWHARRQGAYVQTLQPGAPAYCVHADTCAGLAAQLCWQQAADRHAPDGCTAR